MSVLVSILTPSYNQAQWLTDTLHSVACQTHPHIEHIVMDGGSTDETVALLADAGTNVIWRSEPDKGQADAINKAFAASTGEIIGWINSDDAYFDCQVVADVVTFFESNPEVDVVYGHCVQTTESGAFIQILWAPPFNAGLLKIVDFITQPGVFIRRKALCEPMLDEAYHFALDYELWLRLAATGKRFARIPRIVGIDRHQPGRKSLTMLDVHAENTQRLVEGYGAVGADAQVGRRSRFYLQQRIAGAAWIGRARVDLAFATPPNPRKGLLRRQIFSRRSSWPTEYR